MAGVLLMLIARKKQHRVPPAVKAFSESSESRSHSNGSRSFKLPEGEVDPADIQICKRPDGSEWLLGEGTFGQVHCDLAPSHQGSEKGTLSMLQHQIVPGDPE